MKKPNWLIIEKPQFNRMPKIAFSLSRYCYLLPTGCGSSKSLHKHTYENRHNNEDVYSCQAQWITNHYTLFFLWFRLDITMWESTKGMGKSLMKNFNQPTPNLKGEKLFHMS